MKLIDWEITPYNLMIFAIRFIFIIPLVFLWAFVAFVGELFHIIEMGAKILANGMVHTAYLIARNMYSKRFVQWVIFMFPYDEQKQGKNKTK